MLHLLGFYSTSSLIFANWIYLFFTNVLQTGMYFTHFRYDKIKPYGFAINGAIDGYSRRIMWLEVGPSNSDPHYVAKYYMDCVQQQGGKFI